ncbi:MAG: HD-GYP domain-containing protein [Phycisphaerales bacterium]|nr:HD-GYP domain-containing protein [Phycisphaerales bacterium]MCB9856004.1 HD-GYP domain-containing protein [Phycisphaerales bacterium]MCB9864969.1 HD-GYP domain-containing protein [Phycisphaerales bacterium]
MNQAKRLQRRVVSGTGVLGAMRDERRDRGIISDAVLGDLRLGLASELSLSTTDSLPALADYPAHTRSARANTILGLLAALQAKDPYTAEHSIRVEVYARKLAQRLGLAGAPTRDIRVGAILHDVGKIAIPDAILNKPGRLTIDEFDLMKSHPVRGVAILRPIAFLEPILPMVMHHHEWYDGTGYPEGIAGEEIPFGARVIQVADCIDAMAWTRHYRRELNMAQIISELEKGAGRQFDPEIAAAAIDWIGEGPQCIYGIMASPSPTAHV